MDIGINPGKSLKTAKGFIRVNLTTSDTEGDALSKNVGKEA
jgi:hypothetical protein